MERNDIPDTLDDVRDELYAMAYETFAMMIDAAAELGSERGTLDRGRVAALEALSNRLTSTAETVQEVNNTLAMSDRPSQTFAGLTVIEAPDNE